MKVYFLVLNEQCLRYQMKKKNYISFSVGDIQAATS